MSRPFAELLDAAKRLLPDAVVLRRELHREPELGLVLPATQERILAALADLGLDVATGGATSAIVATLRGGRPGPTVLLRADMDALPLEEDTQLPFASRREGAMHACGHDAHMAMLVGAARLLAERSDTLAGTVRFCFQPGEEGYGGARILIEEGLLARDPPVEAAFAIHVEPHLPPGVVAARPGPILAAMDKIAIEVRGQGGHGSMPHLALDPVPIAAEIVLALQSLVTRRTDPFDPVVLSVTKMQAGTTHNVIPARAHLEGTLRCVSNTARERIHGGLRRVVEGIAGAHGAQASVSIETGYPPTLNDAHFLAFAREVVQGLLGPDAFVELPSPIMGSEDFSYFLERVPGSIVFLGVRPPDVEPQPLHSNRMVLDEEAMANGIALHAAVALAYCDA